LNAVCPYGFVYYFVDEKFVVDREFGYGKSLNNLEKCNIYKIRNDNLQMNVKCTHVTPRLKGYR
jgi:hypothetical protein